MKYGYYTAWENSLGKTEYCFYNDMKTWERSKKVLEECGYKILEYFQIIQWDDEEGATDLCHIS